MKQASPSKSEASSVGPHPSLSLPLLLKAVLQDDIGIRALVRSITTGSKIDNTEKLQKAVENTL